MPLLTKLSQKKERKEKDNTEIKLERENTRRRIEYKTTWYHQLFSLVFSLLNLLFFAQTLLQNIVTYVHSDTSGAAMRAAQKRALLEFLCGTRQAQRKTFQCTEKSLDCHEEMKRNIKIDFITSFYMSRSSGPR